MRVIPIANLKRKAKQTYSSIPPQLRSKNKRKKRKLSCSSVEEFVAYNSRKRQKRHALDNSYFYEAICKSFPENSYRDSQPSDRFVIEKELVWSKVKEAKPKSTEKPKDVMYENSRSSFRSSQNSKCWINELPQELLLKIFSYLPLGMLLHIIPRVSKKWEGIALDWTLWKTVEDLTIKNMVISTAKLKTLLRTIPRLKKLELFSRNDTEELLKEIFQTHRNLEVLKLDCCYRSTLQMNMLSETVISILEFCPKLKTIIFTDTYFHSDNFYKCLAKKFQSMDRITVTCTSKSEMDIFLENLKENVSEVQFQKVSMMGRAAGKQIYWGPILGLVVRPIPTSPFHHQCVHENFPNYAF